MVGEKSGSVVLFIDPEWDWVTCVNCGDAASDFGLLLGMLPEKRMLEVQRFGWCQQHRCQIDRAVTKHVEVSPAEVEMFDEEAFGAESDASVGLEMVFGPRLIQASSVMRLADPIVGNS